MSKKKYRKPAGNQPAHTQPAPQADSPAVEASDSDAEVSVEEARKMLSGAARLMDVAVKMARKAFSQVTNEQLRKLAQDEPDEPQPSDQRKRARGARPVLLQLLNAGVAASRLLKQTLRVLQPEMFGAKPAKDLSHEAYQKQRAAEIVRKQLTELGVMA